MKEVSKEEFDKFLESYGAEYVQNTKHFCSPPVTVYYDKKKMDELGTESAVIATACIGGGWYDCWNDYYHIKDVV